VYELCRLVKDNAVPNRGNQQKVDVGLFKSFPASSGKRYNHRSSGLERLAKFHAFRSSCTIAGGPEVWRCIEESALCNPRTALAPRGPLFNRFVSLLWKTQPSGRYELVDCRIRLIMWQSSQRISRPVSTALLHPVTGVVGTNGAGRCGGLLTATRSRGDMGSCTMRPDMRPRNRFWLAQQYLDMKNAVTMPRLGLFADNSAPTRHLGENISSSVAKTLYLVHVIDPTSLIQPSAIHLSRTALRTKECSSCLPPLSCQCY
jgi:hypothetical protein